MKKKEYVKNNMKIKYNYYNSNLLNYLKTMTYFLSKVSYIKIYAFGNSMEPKIRDGSIIYLKPYKKDQLKVDDIIFVVQDNYKNYFIHRIVLIDKQFIITKGDKIHLKIILFTIQKLKVSW